MPICEQCQTTFQSASRFAKYCTLRCRDKAKLRRRRQRDLPLEQQLEQWQTEAKAKPRPTPLDPHKPARLPWDEDGSLRSPDEDTSHE